MAIKNRALAPRCFYEHLLPWTNCGYHGEHHHAWFSQAIDYFAGGGGHWYSGTPYELFCSLRFQMSNEGYLKPAGVLIERKLTELWPRNNVLP